MPAVWGRVSSGDGGDSWHGLRWGAVRLRAFGKHAVELLLPAECVHCGAELTASERGLCDRCWNAIEPLPSPSCPRCARRMDAGEQLCWQCADEPPVQQSLAVAGLYSGPLRSAVLAMKHQRRDDLVEPLARRLGERVAGLSVDTVVPVPSHPWHRIRRGGVATELMARSLASRLGVSCQRVLIRHGARRQAGQGRSARRRLPVRAFTVRRRLAGVVLLVDDVHTTGTTIRHCSRALVGAGASAVHCAVIAWTPESGRSV